LYAFILLKIWINYTFHMHIIWFVLFDLVLVHVFAPNSKEDIEFFLMFT
jgi:hypothetical protein